MGTSSALGFAILGALVVRRGGLPLDASVAAFIQGLPIPVAFWEACSRLGGGTLVLVGVALVLGALSGRRVRLALIIAGTLLLASLFTDVVKDLVARPRPPGADLIGTAGSSFPSGHALNSTATYGLVALVTWRSDLSRAIRLAVAVVVGALLPILIGLSRIALDVHYPSDVLGGWLAGIAFVALAATLITVTHAMERDPPARPAVSSA
jgi:membrane-associated phospholipid phosphatase